MTTQLTLDLGFVQRVNPRRDDYERLIGSTVSLGSICHRCHRHCVAATVVEVNDSFDYCRTGYKVIVKTPCGGTIGLAPEDIKIHTVHPGRQKPCP